MSIASSRRRAAPTRRRRRFRMVPALPVTVLVMFVVVALAVPMLMPWDPVQNDLANGLKPPAWLEGGSASHLLGTDSFGRDVLTRLVYGARITLLVVVLSLLISVVIGASIGAIAGYAGGAIDAVLMRLVDIMLGLPAIIVALAAAVALGPSLRNVVLILGLLMWPDIARLVRGDALLVRQQDYVRYPRAIGIGHRRILMRHVIPNVLPTLLVVTTLQITNVILTEASLSFLGAGVPPPSPSWGVMIEDGRALVATGWWIAFFPGLAIVVTVLAANALGDWLRDHLDPKTREI